jgi:predicted DNA-binding helix-hairpin-helix protein
VTHRLLAAGAATGLLALAGCGGSSTDVKSQINKICKDTNTKLKSLKLSSEADIATKGAKALPIIKDGLTRMGKVKASNDTIKAHKADYTQFLTTFAEAGIAFQTMVSAAQAKDAAALKSAEAQFQKFNAQNDAVAKKLGFNDCVSGG